MKSKNYVWIHPRTKKLYARVQIRQANGKYKTYLKTAATASEAALIAIELFEQIGREKLDGEISELFFAVKENQTDFRSFRKRILNLINGSQKG